MRAPHVFPLVDTDRRERAVFCALAVALVLLRGFVATSYEGFFFDSDQAIVGLMARRLSSFREFPLFYYGLNYLLAVEAWIIAPFFWIARSSVTVMRLPFVALNAITAVSLVTALTGSLRLRPALAFVADLPRSTRAHPARARAARRSAARPLRRAADAAQCVPHEQSCRHWLAYRRMDRSGRARRDARANCRGAG